MSKLPSDNLPQTIYLKDYQPSAYLIETTELHFELDEKKSQVQARLEMVHNPKAKKNQPLVLDGEALELLSLKLDGELLEQSAYELTVSSLTIKQVPENFILEIITQINPKANTTLSGLYQSSGNFCTQCEAQGFRRIMYYLDRPDVMSRFTTTLVANKEHYPVLLSNGNCVEKGEFADGKHWAKWEDPFKKPCYLFAVVAGKLDCLRDEYTTMSGRKVALELYVEPGNLEKSKHAMLSLKQSMKWDEDVYRREYDLDSYMIVAVSDFNMGAMENKGLNIFNTKYVLADPQTATDADYEAIQSVIGHEYFHNWTGNRITCRDWFQLCLKEGLTVFRDQSFSQDMTSSAVKRIQDVKLLRAHQFPQDAGPMAHAVRPDSYIEINNFYTVTVYEKGAEVYRMLHCLLGNETFQKGMDLYFERHDGQAVTMEDIFAVMSETSGCDLNQFSLWYTQAGTPELEVITDYDAVRKLYTLQFRQSCPATPDQEEKQPLHIPVAIGLLDQQGNELPLQLTSELEEDAVQGTRVIEIKGLVETIQFAHINEKPVPSVLRGFSAPVKLKINLGNEELMFLWQHDTEGFNRWEAGYQLACRQLLALVDAYQQGETLVLDTTFVNAFKQVLYDQTTDKALLAQMLLLPDEIYLNECLPIADVESVHAAREFMITTLANDLFGSLLAVYQENDSTKGYSIAAQDIAKRSLRNCCLGYLGKIESGLPYIIEQFATATNMTDSLAALTVLSHSDVPERDQCLESFYQRWQQDELVIGKWLSVQARMQAHDVLTRVEDLMKHSAFDIKNPNKVYALIGGFCGGNLIGFHQPSGDGYCFLKEQIIALDKLNPQVAARMVGPLTRWQHYDELRQALMKQQLQELLNVDDLSKDVYEIVNKSLGEVYKDN